MAQARVAIVTTANRAIGTGHLQRCLTLSDALRARSARTALFVYAGDPSTCAWAKDRTDEQVIAPDLDLDSALGKARAWSNLMVVDTYDAGETQLAPLMREGARVLVVDDLADRRLPATWILNTCFPSDSIRYEGLGDATLLLGPRYALLRPEFTGLARRETPARARRILVLFGGSDPLGQTARVLRLLHAMPGPLEVTVVAGLLTDVGPVRDALAGFPHPAQCLRDVRNVHELMQAADIAVSGAGQTLFELAAAGCPAIALQVADNQRWSSSLFTGLGSIEAMDARTIDDATLARAIAALADDPARRARMSAAGREAADGLGAGRVADLLLRRS
jgi:UDP-2,4-diacetamido-2,4,6-trideoxy-beta-L-altropyranose hydrolase